MTEREAFDILRADARDAMSRPVEIASDDLDQELISIQDLAALPFYQTSLPTRGIKTFPWRWMAWTRLGETAWIIGRYAPDGRRQCYTLAVAEHGVFAAVRRAVKDFRKVADLIRAQQPQRAKDIDEMIVLLDRALNCYKVCGCGISTQQS